MRNRLNWMVLAFVVALTAFSVIVVWPGAPKRYLPDFVPWPEGNGLKVGGFERREMRLGLDLKGGTYVLLEADTSRLPPGTDISDALDGVKDVLERRVNAFGVSETEITREGSNRLAVQMPGVDPDEARELVGKTAQLEFRAPVLDESRNVVCGTEDGGTYAQPFPARPIEETEVDATLGDREVVRSVQAGLIGILAVMVFMVLYYRLPGLLAVLALSAYVSVVLMLFKIGPLIGPVTITLAGIAGFVLSVGMAVDANILVFERLKEELRAGRNLTAAIEHGFDRAWTSIRDSNVSTLITCAILWWFGEQFGASLVKGFALTLGLGVLISMFSAIVVTRTLLRLMVGTPLARRLELFAPDLSHAVAPLAAGAPAMPDGAQTGARLGVPQRGRGARSGFMLDFVKRRGFYFALSSVVLVPGIIALLIQPSLKPGIEFSSGATFTAQFERSDVSQDDVRRVLSDLGHSEARVQKTSGGAFIIRTAELEGAVGPPVGPPPPGA